MDGDGEDDLDGFLLGGDESDDATTNAGRHHSSGSHRSRRRASRTGPRNGVRRRNSIGSSSSLSDDNEPGRNNASSGEKSSDATTRHRDRKGSDGSPKRKAAKTKKNERRARQQIDDAIEAALSSSSGSGGDHDGEKNLASSGRKATKSQSRLKPKPASEVQRGTYQAGDAVEARFGGRSKWFPGKVRQVYDGRLPGDMLYDIDFDDGDKEERVVAGRVRSPGQRAPALEAGSSVDVKLARKGKGYHPGKIGRVNDDGSFYVKLDDGDSEWSVPALQLIPAYPYAPTTVAPDHGGSSPGPPSHQPSSATIEEGLPQSSVSVLAQEVEAGEATTGPLSAPPPGEQGIEESSERKGEDNGGGDGGDGGGGGVSWIAELASSVGALPAGEAPPIPAPTTETDKQLDDANGLGWIAEVASHVVEGPANLRQSSLSPKGGPTATRSTAGTAETVSTATRSTTPAPGAAGLVSSTRSGASSPPPTTTAISATTPISGGRGGGGGEATPGTTKTKPPQAQTPIHLTWKPTTDGTASRRWGAPPPDENEDKTVAESPQKQQEMTSPPRLSRSLRAPEPSAAASGHTSNYHLSGRLDSDAGGGGGRNGTPADAKLPTAAHLLSSEASKRKGLARGKILPPGDRAPTKGAVVTGEGEAGLETRPSNKESPHASDNSTVAIAVASDAQDHSGAVPGKGDNEISTEAQKQCPGVPPRTVPPLQESVSASGQGGRGSTRWDVLRSFVQRRYAAEAVHLSEEVRLLAARLKVADDRAQAKLEQQERQLVGNMEEVLRRERVKMQAQLAEERASNARRVGALEKELDAAKRQLQLERNRATKGAARELLHSRRARTPPPLGHTSTPGRRAMPNAATRRGRCDGRPENTHRVPCNGPFTGPAQAITSRRRSASSTAPARTTVWGGAEVSELLRPPPPPLSPFRGTSSSGKGFPASSAATTSRRGTRDRPSISEFSVGDFPLPPTPAESRAEGGASGIDAGDGTAEPATVEGDATYTDAATDALRRSGRRERGDHLRWKLETERRDTRRRLEAMKGEVERVVAHFRARTERAEAAAISAETRAAIKALRYLRSKPQVG